ncbi:transcription termination factor 1 isoform X2 [Pseudophryne corroboree]|uniref:transcription termination factor 1 isoform X2 n=1 Tax=Pseudophryne corroboree TaxID=495146 RepID=UPI003081CAC7
MFSFSLFTRRTRPLPHLYHITLIPDPVLPKFLPPPHLCPEAVSILLSSLTNKRAFSQLRIYLFTIKFIEKEKSPRHLVVTIGTGQPFPSLMMTSAHSLSLSWERSVNPAAAVLSKKLHRSLGQTSDLGESSDYHSQNFNGGDAKKRKRKINSDVDPPRKKGTLNESQDTEPFSPTSKRINGHMSFDKYTDLEDHQTSSKKKKKQKPSQQVDESLDDKASASDGPRDASNTKGKSPKKRKSSVSCDNIGDSEDSPVTEHNTPIEGIRRRKKHMRDSGRYQMEDGLSGDLLGSDDHSTVSIEDDSLQAAEPTSEGEDRAGKSAKKNRSLHTAVKETSTSLLEETEFETDNGNETHCDSSPETDQAPAGPSACSDVLDENQNADDNGTGLSAVDTGRDNLSPRKRSRLAAASPYIRDRDLAVLEEVFPNVRSLTYSSLQNLIQNELERIKDAKLRGIKFATGRFNRAEDEQIKKNVEEFLALTGLESGEMLFHSYRYPELKPTIEKIKRKFHFRQRIAKGVYHTIGEICHRGPKIYDSSGSKGRFTDEEVKKLKESWNLHGNKWTIVGALVGRNNISAQLKASQLRRKVNHGLWSSEETNLLISAVKEFVLNSGQKTAEGKNQEVTAVTKHKICKGIPWVSIEEKVKTRNWTHCKRKWFELALIRMNDGINPFEGPLGIETTINMINWLHESDVKESGEVKWEEMTDDIGNIPPWIAQTRFHKLKSLHVPDFKKLSFSDTMNYLYNVTLPDLEAKLEELSNSEHFPSPVPEKRDQFLVSEIFQEYTGSERMQLEIRKRPKSKRRPKYT